MNAEIDQLLATHPPEARPTLPTGPTCSGAQDSNAGGARDV